MPDINWFDISYLKTGNKIQIQAFNILHKSNLTIRLKAFNPVVIGTIPIGISIPNSDLDIACYATDFDYLKNIARENFSMFPHFTDKIYENSYVANFKYDLLPIEIYAEQKPVELQSGFRHMVIENRILHLAGKNFRKKVIELKMKGCKTEPAFGKLLKMEDSYTELLDLENLTDTELKTLIISKYEVAL